MNGPGQKTTGKYERPPIQEAICELHFKVQKPLEQADIERIQPVWKPVYPNQQIVAEQNVEVRLSMDRVDAKSTPTGYKLITRSADGKDLAQLGSRFIAVNRLPPYPGWEESFRRTILDRLTDAMNIYRFQEIERVGLRYINKIDLPASPVRWSDWFSVSLPVPADLGKRGGLFQFHFEQVLSGNMQAIINFMSLPIPAPPVTSVILDIDVVWRGLVSVADALDVLENVHTPHHSLFEAYLLDKTRALFQITSQAICNQ